MLWVLILLGWFCGVGVTQAAPVLLVRGTTSVPKPAERQYAATLTRHLSRWLGDLNLPHTVVDDDALTDRQLARARVAVLGYNPKPDAATLALYRRFLGTGGKLVVFYADDARLAELMDMRLGAYMAADRPGRWAEVRFNAQAPAHLPGAYRQESRHVRTVLALPGRSRTIAVWADTAGKQSDVPAWVQSGRGFWMTHVMLDDGDTEHKRQVLLALLAACDPTLWADAAAHLANQSARLPGYTNFADTVAGLRAMAGETNPALERDLRQADALQADIAALRAGRRYPEAILRARELRSALQGAYAGLVPGRDPEFRAVWEHTGTGPYPGDWNRTCAELRVAGITDLFVNLLSAAQAHYPSRLLTLSEPARLQGDQARAVVRAARAHGLRVHAWKLCWKLEGVPAERMAELDRLNRLQRTDTGESLPWLCPTHPENIEQEWQTIEEVLSRQTFDGLQLDYIRYPDSRACYCAGCRARFESARGARVAGWPAEARRGAAREEFARWRADQITRFVKLVRTRGVAMQPDLRLSAAVYGSFPSSITSIGQDWGAWVREGLVDFVCPMNYTENPDDFGAWTRRHLALPGAEARVFPGIGVSATESRLDPVQTLMQIQIARAAGARGFALFQANRTLLEEILPLLSRRATRAP